MPETKMVHLHTHTENSMFDGCGKQLDFVRKAKEQGCPAIAITEHGSLRGLYKLHMNCTKEVGDIKPIFGIEFYLAEDLKQKGLSEDVVAAIRKEHPRGQQSEAVYQAEVAAGVRERFHLTILARDNEGLRSLYRLSSISWIDGYYKRPRIDMKALEANRAGLIVLSGCLSGPISTAILKGDFPLALQRAEQLHSWFGDDFYIELMPHSLPEQIRVNRALLRIAEALDLPIVGTQDAHYIERSDWRYQEALLCIHTKDVLANPERFKFDTHDFWLRTRPEMEEAFRINSGGFMDSALIKRSLDATLEIDEKCLAKLEIDRFKALVPPVPIPPEFGGDEFKYMVHLCQMGWETRKIEERAKTVAPRFTHTYSQQHRVYLDRLKYELGAIKRQKVVRYFLVVWDMYQWVRAQGICCGPGRGSAGGSLVSFLLGITDIDPIEHRLIFERFLSPSRIDLPDIDCDFEDVRREEVITFLRGRYGDDKTCQIATVGTLKGKACIKDLGRVMGIPFEEVNNVTGSIIERSSGDERASSTIEDSFREFKVCQEFNAKYPQVLEYAKKLEGQAKSVGVHAAGVIVSPVPLVDVIPLETRQVAGKTTIVVSALDMYGAQGVGLMKLDILGIRNLTVIRECLTAIKQRHSVDIDLDWIDLNDKRVLDLFTDHDYVGIFQYDTPSADKISEGVKFTSFEDVAAMIALDRPGTARSGLATEYLKRKQDPSKIKSIHPIVDKICEDTYGVIVYQEHVIRIFVELAGYAPGTADSLRHKIAKKHGAESLGKEREEFIAGAVKRGCDKVTAEKLIDQIKMFGCVLVGSKLATPLGARPIEVLRRGDLVTGPDGRSNRIKAIGRSGVKFCYRTVLDDGTSEVTSGDHWFKRENGEWARVIDLLPGDKLLSGYGTTVEAARQHQGRNVQGEVVSLRQDGARLENRTPLDHGTEAREATSFVGVGPPQGRERPEQRRSQPCSDGSRWTSEVASERSAVQERLFGSGDEPGHVRPMLAEGISGTPYSSRESGELRACVDRPREGQGLEARNNTRTVVRIEAVGEQETWDLELEDEPNTYVLAATGLTTHNSYGFNRAHSVAYGLIAYREMFLKTYYPVEFYWALLKNEPERDQITRTVKDARKHDIEVRPPDVNSAGATWKMDDQAVIGSLADLKGVGPATITPIVENQPFKSFVDFMARVPRRQVNKRVITVLAKAGALNNIVPNPRWLLENLDDVWDQFGKADWERGVARRLIASASEPGFTEDDAQMAAAEVNPLAFGKHPLEPWQEWMSSTGRSFLAMDDDGVWEEGSGWIYGQIIEIKYNQVGDFHTGSAPTEAEKRRMKWGARYSNINLEDVSGAQRRIKVDTDIFEDYRHIIDKGTGTIVAAHVSFNKRFKSVRAHFLVDLVELRTKMKNGEPLSPFQRAVIPELHPVAPFSKSNIRIAAGHGKPVPGLVTHVNKKLDKKMGEMAFFGLLGVDGFVEGLVFASSWATFRNKLVSGAVVEAGMRQDGGSFILDSRGGTLKLLASAT